MALVQTVLAQRAVDKGLGKKMDLLEDEQIDAYYKVCNPLAGVRAGIVILILTYSTPMQLK